MWRLIVSRPWSAVTMRVCGAAAPDWDVAAAGAIAPRSTVTARMRIIFVTSLIIPLLRRCVLWCDRARRPPSTRPDRAARLPAKDIVDRGRAPDDAPANCRWGGVCGVNWSGRQDSNLRLPAPKAVSATQLGAATCGCSRFHWGFPHIEAN